MKNIIPVLKSLIIRPSYPAIRIVSAIIGILSIVAVCEHAAGQKFVNPSTRNGYDVEKRTHIVKSPASVYITMDSADYHPGSTAHIAGGGFLPNETIKMQVLFNDGTPSEGASYMPWTVQANKYGKFTASWDVHENDRGHKLVATAKGLTSFRYTELAFTDATVTSSCFINPDGTYTNIAGNDDGAVGPVTIPFTFKLFGTSYTSVYINNNGNLSFGASNTSYTSGGFPNTTPMIAPFWADVDTRVGATVKYKIFPHKLIVSWAGVGYYNQEVANVDSFQVIISDGLDSTVGIGSNVSFYYGKMNWTTGDASGGSGGFGGTPATVGINAGDNSRYLQIGRFGLNSSVYTNSTATAGVHYLDYTCYTFNVASATNTPPSVTGLPTNRDTVVCGTTGQFILSWLAPETDQTVFTTVDTGTLCNLTVRQPSNFVPNAKDTFSITGASCNIGSHQIVVTATDNHGGVTKDTITVVVIPFKPTPSSNSPVCTGSTLNLTSAGGLTGAAYSWTGPGGFTSTLQNPTRSSMTSTMAGKYYVTVTSPGGCSSLDSTTVVVNALPTIGAGAGVAVCNGATASMTATGGVSYSWAPSIGLAATTGATVSANPSSTTVYTVTGTSALGCSNTATKTITVNALPSVSAGSGASICIGASASLTATGGVSYTWTPAAGLSSTTAATVTATPTVTTTYTVTGVNANGCSNNATATVTVNAIPVISAGAAGSVCSGSSLVMTASGGVTYTWAPTSGLSATTGATVTTTPAAAVVYTITGTSAAGCVGTGTKSISLLTLPSVSVGSASPICSGSSAVVTASGADTYSWSPATGMAATTGSTATMSPLSTTSYTVTGTNAAGCSNTARTTVTVNATPVVNAGSGVAVCTGSSSVLAASGAVTYSWAPSVGLSATTGASVTAAPSASTTYTITGTSASGCVATTTKTVTVNSLPVISAGSSVAICTGASATLSATGGVAYVWTGSALSATTGSSVVATPSATATYSVVGTDVNGCTNVSTVPVSVSPLPVSVSAGSAVCQGSSAVISASGATSYSWAPSTGLSSVTGSSVTASPASTIVYTVTGTAGACSNSATVVITVNPRPSVGASSGVTICAGTSTNLTATGGVTYSWSPSAGLVATTGASVTAIPSSATTYTVVGTNSLGCSNSATVSVAINSAPAMTVVSNSGAICAGGTVAFTSAATGGTGALSYSWSGPSSFSSTVQNPSLTGALTTASGAYTVTVTDANGCHALGSNVTVATVNPMPSVGAITGPSSVCVGNTVTLANSTTGGVWSASSDLATIGSATGVVTGVAINGLTITYTVVNIYSCSTYVTKSFNVTPAPGNIYTYIGTGTNATTGDGGPAHLASIQGPRAITTDNAGNVYFCDVTANLIRKVATNGMITTVAGNGTTGTAGDGGPATAAQLSMSGGGGIYVDNTGNIYISNTFAHTIRKVSASTGIITKIAGTGVSGYSGDGIAATAAKINSPMGLTLDTAGNIYFADQSNHRVRKIDAATGIITTIAGNGSSAYSGDGGAATAARLSYPKDVILDNSGNLYIADASNNVIRKCVMATGIITTLAGNNTAGSGGDGGPATAGQLNGPVRASYDGGNYLYVADQNNNKIRQIDLTTGMLSTVVANGGTGFSGDGGAAIASHIWVPCGIAADRNGYLYIADANNRRVRVASALGSIRISVAGATTISSGTPVTFTASSAVNNSYASLQWQKNGVNVGATSSTYTATSISSGDVFRCILTVTPDCGAAFSDTSNAITILVAGARQSNTTTEVEGLTSAGSLKVYPNPVHDQVNIEAADVANGVMQVNVFDQMGRVVISKEVAVIDSRLNEQFDMASMPVGMYIISLTDHTGKTMVVRCVKN